MYPPRLESGKAWHGSNRSQGAAREHNETVPNVGGNLSEL